MKEFFDEMWDVIVCGSGPAGLGAAVAAAKQGMKVLLLEAAGQPGGTICAVPFMPVNRLRLEGGVRSAVHEALITEMEAFGEAGGGPGPSDAINGDGFCPQPEYAEMAIYNMLDKAGVTLRLFSPVLDAVTEAGVLRQVIVREKRGLVHYRGRIFVDATGDGDLAVAAGCGYAEGKDTDAADESVQLHVVDRVDAHAEAPIHMPITLGFSLGGMENGRFLAWMEGHKAEFRTMLEEADAKGLYVAAWYGFFHGKRDNVMGVNNGAWKHQPLTSDGLNAADRTQVRRNGLRLAIDTVRIFRENRIPGAENCYLERTGGILGVRDTRRIEGEYCLTFADTQTSREFPDIVARKYGAIDANQLFIGKMDSGFAYPYRSLVPKGVDGLLLAGRCGSATFFGHSAGKSMGNMMALGVAAGTAAALCLQEAVQPRALDTAKLRTLLRMLGTRL